MPAHVRARHIVVRGGIVFKPPPADFPRRDSRKRAMPTRVLSQRSEAPPEEMVRVGNHMQLLPWDRSRDELGGVQADAARIVDQQLTGEGPDRQAFVRDRP